MAPFLESMDATAVKAAKAHAAGQVPFSLPFLDLPLPFLGLFHCNREPTYVYFLFGERCL